MKRLLTLTTMVLMISLLAFSASAQDTDQADPQGKQHAVHHGDADDVSGAPNSGDGVSDGSGWTDSDDYGAPNSGDGIPDGSGWDKAFVDEDMDGINDAQRVRDWSDDPRAEIRGEDAQGDATGGSSGTMNENNYSGLDPRTVDGGHGGFSDVDGFGPAGDDVTGDATGGTSEPGSGGGSGSGSGGKK